jgi:hypothetical protein
VGWQSVANHLCSKIVFSSRENKLRIYQAADALPVTIECMHGGTPEVGGSQLRYPLDPMGDT